MHSEGMADGRADDGAAGGPDDRWVANDLQRADAQAPQEWPQTPPRAEPPADNTVIDGRYELLSPIGSGGMGEVWKAHDRRLRRFVAVKGLLDRHSMTPTTQAEAMQRARREAEAIAKIEHQNVVTVHDQVETDNQVWIVMKLLEARSLADLLSSEKVLAVPRSADIGLQILQGLRAVHGASVVHRDVKPGNVLVRDDGLVILVDFGIAKFDGGAQVTQHGGVLGTPPYLAPELFAPGAPAPTPASDLWALGITLFLMVEGHVPFAGNEVWEVQEQIRSSPTPAFRYAGPLAPVIQGLLTTDPQRRLDAAGAEGLLRDILGAPAAPNTPPATGGPAPEATHPPTAAASFGPAPVSGSGPAPASGPAASFGPPPSFGPAPASSPGPQATPPPPSVPASASAAAAAAGGKKRRTRRPWLKVTTAAVCVTLLATAGWLVANNFGSKTDDKTGGVTGSGQGRGGEQETWRSTHPTLKVGVKDDQPGLSKRDKKTGTYTGYDIDLSYELAKRMGYTRDEVDFTTVATDYRSTALKTKKVDLVIASYSITPERKTAAPGGYSVEFAGPYYEASREFLVREKSAKYDIRDTSDLRRLKVEVCTARDSTYEKELPKKGFTMAKTQPNTYQDCLDRLLDKKSDVYAVASDDVILAGYVRDNPGKVRRLEPIEGAEGYGVAMRPKTPLLKGEVCSALKGILDGKVWDDLYMHNLSPLMGGGNPPGRPDLDECTGSNSGS
ncbi:transporter substrate-binding domain-containing protein [Streptomyces sp. NBC_01433]|uniref:serine/threonine-protein kinase n=1 Tax=Streptomyces sp. NBC_01433 TaxID=2903864 RepID=UPI002256B078|nr:serine/threonine-protein kinase [Streptomyces sp. NBC_01433]MCX4675200.1 transporter substrate-binding domain-containing protein [Streptomyces sp. NBC_01433]